MRIETKEKLAFPFVVIWIVIAYLLFKLGDCLRNIGNRMSGYLLDNSIGSVYVN